MFRCPKFVGDAKQILEIRVERKRNLKLGELGEVSFGMLTFSDFLNQNCANKKIENEQLCII